MNTEDIYHDMNQAQFEMMNEEKWHEAERNGEPVRRGLPVFDLNTIESDKETISIPDGEKKELLNLTSVCFASSIIEAIKDGKIDPLEFAVKKKLIIDALELAAKDAEVKEMMLTEAAKQGKDHNVLGAKISVRSFPRYQYGSDPKWKELKDSIAPVEQKMKEQEKKIQTACKNNCSLVSDDGEVIASIVPAPATESIIVSFSKK